MTDWAKLRTEILETFTPGPPINELAQFAGRGAIIQRLQDTTIEREVKRGRAPSPVRIGCAGVRFYEHEVDAWLASLVRTRAVA